MIPVRRLTKKDMAQAYDYIKDEPEVTLFIQSDLELYGLESAEVALYAFGEPWDCILLKYYSDFVLYSKKAQFNAKAVAAFLARQEKIIVISAKESHAKLLQPFYPQIEIYGTYLCRCNKSTFKQGNESSLPTKMLTSEDAPAIVKLYQQVDEFKRPFLEHPKEKLEGVVNNYTNGGVGFGVFENNTLVSAASITALTKKGAMVVGVATHPDYRSRGYASLLVNKVCSHSFAQGLDFLCLFYDNPTAGAIYRRLGFEPMDRWGMLKF